jgi:crotonobetainyl-CoA:carnitine CoA-transferase CaiB-like acyl-CoA transferase
LPAAPRAGQNSREILAEFGYGAADIAALERSGLVIQAN